MARSSVIPGDPGFEHWRQRRPLFVFVDGKPVQYCITADEEAGFAIVHVTDSNGKLLIDTENGGTIQQVIFGRVEILKRQQP